MAKVGDKFVIEISDIFKSEDGTELYRIKGFNSLVFDSEGIRKLNYKTGESMDLKPCPMCGGKAEFCGYFGDTFHVMCTKCGCDLPLLQNAKEVIDRWNKRIADIGKEAE